MKISDGYNLMLEAIAESETGEENLKLMTRDFSFESFMKGISPIPKEAIPFGLATDGLPVLLNTYDPIPGAVAVIGDGGTGKTQLLKNVARFIQGRKPEDYQFCVITNNPEEWSDIPDTYHKTAVFPFYTKGSEELLLSLASWAHGKGKRSMQVVVLLLDGLENVSNLDFDAIQNFRWLLLRGASKKVWTIATINPIYLNDVSVLLEGFPTQIIGRMPEKSARLLQLDDFSTLVTELDDYSFYIKCGKDYYRFNIPNTK